MSDANKKIEKTEPDAKATELSEQDLEQVAGGAAAPPATTVSLRKAEDKHRDI